MSNKIPQTREELEGHLLEQLQFLESSALSYDEGVTSEAKRMATSLRLLLHDTKDSQSLLGQLGLKDDTFYDTSLPINFDNSVTQCSLVAINMGRSGAKPIPFLDGNPENEYKKSDFESWWNAPIFIDNLQQKLTRKDLVLTMANQDGGAHVDPGLEKRYAQLSRNNSLGWKISNADGTKPIKEFERAAIRQITHEVLKTIKPGYTKSMIIPDGIMIAGLALSTTKANSTSSVPVNKNKPQFSENTMAQNVVIKKRNLQGRDITVKIETTKNKIGEIDKKGEQ